MAWQSRLWVLPALIVMIAAQSARAAADEGSCAKDIAAFEQAIRSSAGEPGAGPRAEQSIDAQLGHQPTPATIEADAAHAEARFNAALARAKGLDAEGKSAACRQALAEAKLDYQLPSDGAAHGPFSSSIATRPKD
jgi:hypothetical protein